MMSTPTVPVPLPPTKKKGRKKEKEKEQNRKKKVGEILATQAKNFPRITCVSARSLKKYNDYSFLQKPRHYQLRK